MFSTTQKRLLFLTMVTLAAFLWTGFSFNLFLPDFTWRQYQLSGEKKEIEEPIISSFAHGAVLISHETLFTVNGYELNKRQQRVIEHYNPPLERLMFVMPQLLNIPLVGREQLEQNIKKRYERFKFSGWEDGFNIPLSSIMHLNRQGELQATALWLGNIDTSVCSNQGQCYMITEDPFNNKKIAWYSQDGGINWQLLTRWHFPEAHSFSSFFNPELVGADTHRLWLADTYKIFVSEDKGQSWKIVADILPLLKRNNINLAEEPPPRINSLHWYIDNRQRLLADVTILLSEKWEERRILYRVISTQLEQIISTDVIDIARSSEGEIFFTSSINASRTGLFRLQENGESGLILEHIDRLGKIYVGRNVLAIEKGSGDNAHFYVSLDRGERWKRYKMPGENIAFDDEGDRFIRFPQYYRTRHYQLSTFDW